MFTGRYFQHASRHLVAAAAVTIVISSSPALAQHSPHVAIVQCEESYEWSWDDTQGSSQGLVGLAGLVGVPYETLLLSELLAEPNPSYTSIWFSSCPVLSDASYAALDTLLVDYLGAGGNVFLDGPLGNYAPDPMGMFGVSYRGMDQLSTTLKVIDGGWFPVSQYTVTTGDTNHTIAKRAGLAPDTPVSQGLIDGTETMDLTSLLDPEGAILLELTSPEDPLRYPFLVATTLDSGGRVVAIGSYGNYVGPASPFHNEEPRGYFDNQVMPYLVEALDWLEYGDGPTVGLQLSHAPMTAVGRLDGDWSNELAASEATFVWLLELAENTGLATAYGVVSDFVPDGGWELFHDGGRLLEALGGALGSHSANHDYDMSGNLDAAGWDYEVTGSLDMIRNQVTGGGYAPLVDVFINPGDTIQQADYQRFFADLSLYMSHGFETTVPYSTGVMGFGLPDGVEPVAVVNNVPAPDFQWLYLEEWRYTVDQAAEYQAQLLDYFQHTVGRGVLYNQMWHDYAIGGDLEPLHYPNEDTVRPLFDVNAAHFAANEVYMPSIREVIGKLHIAQKARYTSTVDGNMVTVTINYSTVPGPYRGYAAGMGLRVGNAGAIHAVTVDGVDHPAFTRNTVMLPRPTAGTQTVVVELGEPPSHPRLSFASKPVTSVSVSGDNLTVGWESDNLMHKACASGAAGIIVLHADSLQRTGAETVCGSVAHDSTTSSLSTAVIDSGSSAFFMDQATRPIGAATIDGQTVTLTLPDAREGTLTFRTEGPPIRVTVNGSSADYSRQNGSNDLTVSSGAATVAIELMPCADLDGDGVSDCAGDCNDNDAAIGLCEPEGCCSTSSDPTASLLLAAAVLLLLMRRRRRVS